MAKERGYTKGLNCKQPHIVGYKNEENAGWSEPLTDPSDPVRFSYVNGKSGSIESKAVESVKTK